MKLILLFSFSVFFCAAVRAANILAIYPLHSRSHFIFNEAIVRALHRAGHRITVVHTYPELSSSVENYTVIDATQGTEKFQNVHSIAEAIRLLFDKAKLYHVLIAAQERGCHLTLRTKEIQAILNSNEKQFDVVIVDMIPIPAFYECYSPIAEKLNVPIIGTVTTRYSRHVDAIMGNPYNPAVIHHEYSLRNSAIWSNLLYRFLNTYDYIFDYYYDNYVSTAQVRQIRRQYFPHHENTSKKPSLVFVNGHQILSPRPVVPNIIHIGGVHVSKTNKSLPSNLLKFINEAKHGVIVFSIGSMIQLDSTSPHLLNAFTEAFSQIPQRVIWKSEEKIENVSQNVFQVDWMPQKEVLAHEKVLAFVTHCGMSGIYEAIYGKTPMIMVPVYFDQFANAESLESLGVGIRLDLLTLTADKLLNALNKVVNETRYGDKIRKISSLMRDNQNTAEESIVYWTEYVIRHQGTSYLDTNALHMPLYRYLLLDVILLSAIIIVTVTIVTHAILRKILSSLLKLLCKNNRNSSKKKD